MLLLLALVSRLLTFKVSFQHSIKFVRIRKLAFELQNALGKDRVACKTLTSFGGGVSACILLMVMSLPTCARATSFSATKNPACITIKSKNVNYRSGCQLQVLDKPPVSFRPPSVTALVALSCKSTDRPTLHTSDTSPVGLHTKHVRRRRTHARDNCNY